MWPFRKSNADDTPALETRSYSSIIVENLENEVSGTSLNSRLDTTGVQEIAAGMWSRAFANAIVSPESMREVVTSKLLSRIARDLLIYGQSMHEILVNGSLQLRPVSQGWDIQGGPNPETWSIEITVPGPTTSIEKTVANDSVVLCLYGGDNSWTGCSPLRSASTTAAIIGILEKRGYEEMRHPVGSILPLPDGADLSQIKADIESLRGSIGPSPSSSANFDQGGKAPGKDWMPVRIGPDPKMSTTALRNDIQATLLQCAGISQVFIKSTEQSTLKEAWRQFIQGTILPLGKLVSDEMSLKLDQDISLSFDDNAANSIIERSRSFRQLTSVDGISAEQALRLVGIEGE